MITPTYLSNAYGRNVSIIKLQTEGLSQEESLVQLPFRANCMNWVVGHVLTNRYTVLKLLDGVESPEAERVGRYVRESAPVTGEGEGVLPLSELIELLEQSQVQLATRLAEITSSRLEEQVVFLGDRSQSVAEWLMFFYFHDTYHTGQTETLRQAAGREDKII
jgi:hypothetical protein